MTDLDREALVLAGDAGGTKTLLGLFAQGKRRPLLRVVETYASREFSRLEDMIVRFFSKYPVPVTRACFGVAGPVKNGRSTTTNLPWEISEARIQERFTWPRVRLMNDLVATALAIPLLDGKEICALNKNKRENRQNIGLIAPGTGLGMALLLWRCGGNNYFAMASEAGHVDFGPNSRPDAELWAYLRRRFGHVSTERVLSGPGLYNIYLWLRDSGRYKEPAWLRNAVMQEDPPKVIAEAALRRKSPIAVAAMNRFVAIFGAVAGNLALTGMTTGGLYLGGGIAPKILPFLQEATFMKAFINKGRFAGMLDKIPVRVILNDKAALLGAAQGALSMTNKRRGTAHDLF